MTHTPFALRMARELMERASDGRDPRQQLRAMLIERGVPRAQAWTMANMAIDCVTSANSYN